MKTYQGKGTGLFYVISSGNPQKACCFSRGFNTRKEATNFMQKLQAKQEETGLSVWQVHSLPEFFPDNGRAHKDLQEWEQ